jgi:uncharacterized membrane-anchored protein
MKLKLLCLVLGLQVAWILGTVATQEYGLARGATALLETRPVDPRDLLRGDYVILSYRISDVPRQLFQPPLTNDLPVGTTVFVVLEKRGKFHEAVSAALERPEVAPGQLVLRGKSVYSWQSRIEYGLERYYVPEGTGNPNGKLTVEISVPPSGNALIKQVFINDRPYREVMKRGN